MRGAEEGGRPRRSKKVCGVEHLWLHEGAPCTNIPSRRGPPNPVCRPGGGLCRRGLAVPENEGFLHPPGAGLVSFFQPISHLGSGRGGGARAWQPLAGLPPPPPPRRPLPSSPIGRFWTGTGLAKLRNGPPFASVSALRGSRLAHRKPFASHCLCASGAAVCGGARHAWPHLSSPFSLFPLFLFAAPRGGRRERERERRERRKGDKAVRAPSQPKAPSAAPSDPVEG